MVTEIQRTVPFPCVHVIVEVLLACILGLFSPAHSHARGQRATCLQATLPARYVKLHLDHDCLVVTPPPVSEPDPQKHQKEGLEDRLGWKCTALFMIACLRVHVFIENTNRNLLV